MSNVIQYKELKEMAVDVAKSGFFASVRSEAQAVTLMLVAQAEGIHPMQALMQYDVINGRPAPKATTILARFQDAGGTVEWLETNDQKAVAKFSHPNGGSITIEWNMERAKQAGLLKNETWSKYPAQMLRARCIPEGIRAIYPAVLSGMYTVDEVRDFTELKPVDDTVCVEVIPEPKKEETPLDKEKRRLASKLKSLQFTNSEIKEFAELFKLTEDVEALRALNGNEALLNEKVKEYEEVIK
jgi:hypothetical protein